ncbi:hypothetical protein AMS68_005011 [Peltaster fructicola]|uniref:AAA+ ATPase domain-containing protein n=1 Tax=Peltaster fructicola TaxID=286661 RepID=A0A6H0XXN5_9PEZI|nr:hypothetical protein AMS68_005011 [Peltaster fructicola]
MSNGTSTSHGEGAGPELVKLDPSEVGMLSEYKHLYSGKEDKRGRFQWQNEIPEDVGKPAEDAEAQKFAILVRHVKTFNDPRRVLSMHSIVIQSPLLKTLLGEVLAGYPGVTVGLQRLEFSGRFEPLIHRWGTLLKAIEALEVSASDQTVDSDLTTKLDHAKLLYRLLANEFQEVIDSAVDMVTQGVTTFELLWTLFQPGNHVYSKVQGQDRVFRLHSSKYGVDRNGNPVYWVTCQYIDFDGTRFGTNKLNIMIPKYEGTKSIGHLIVFPLSFHSAKEDIRQKLIQRGAKMVELAGSHYRGYNGIGWRTGNMGQIEKYSVKGRVVIDGYGWNRFNPNLSIYVTPLHLKDNNAAVGFGSSEVTGDDPYGDDYDAGQNDESEADDGGMPMDGFFVEEDDNKPEQHELSEEQKLIASPFVRGYALKEKLWLNLFVNAVQDITFNNRAFESLVLPSNQKELILGFTATQQNYRSQFDDVIEGKGRGIILLLCGPPGVGKTLTAESVAEEMRVPLYMMSAGDLGLEPRQVETKLQGILDMCTRWNAILLLDEADVFLTERTLHELERNKLVSIFLRVLEYYEGIMFLTTNRVHTFDAAFQSRIHISIDYPELSIESRRTVWENFLKQHNVAQAASREKPLKVLASAAKSNDIAKVNGELTSEEQAKQEHETHLKRTLPHKMSERDVDTLSQMSMNGRQIKNILKTAQLLASRRGEGLSKSHIMTVLDVTQHLHNATNEKESTRSSIFS